MSHQSTMQGMQCHLRSLCVLVLTLSGFLLGGLQRADASRWRPAHRTNQNPSLLKKVLRPKRMALIIGVGEYKSPHWPNLHYASRDVQRMKQVLQGKGKFDHITTLLGRAQTTRQKIWAALQELRRRNTSPWDTIMVYISAHGTVAYNGGQQAKGARYVVTSDAGTNIPATALSVDKIRRLLERFTSRRKVLMLATCYTGAAGSKSRLAPGNKGQVSYQAAQRSRTMLILSAASLHQPAFESKELKSDVYTHFFLRCLKKMSGKSWPASASRVHACAVGPTFRYVKKKFGQVQLPGLESRIDGLDAVYLAGVRKPERVQTKRKSKRAVVQVFRQQLQRWKIRLFRKGQKGTVARLDQVGDVLLTLPPGHYKVVMAGQDGFSRRAFPLHLQADTRLILAPPTRMGFSVEAGARSSPMPSVPIQVGGSLAFHFAFLSLRLGYWAGGGAYTSSTFVQHQINLQLEGAWSPWWGRFGLSLGAFVGGGLLLQGHSDGLHYGPLLQYGIKAGPRFRWHPAISIDLYARVGFVLLPLGNNLEHRFWASGNLGVTYSF